MVWVINCESGDEEVNEVVDRYLLVVYVLLFYWWNLGIGRRLENCVVFCCWLVVICGINIICFLGGCWVIFDGVLLCSVCQEFCYLLC